MRESLSAVGRAAGNPGIRRLLLGFAGSAIGYWAAAIAVTVFAFAAGGPAAVALALLMRVIPSAIAAPVMATLADRHSRRRVMILADLARAVVLVGMALLVVADAPPVAVFVAAALAGVLGSAFEPAKQALLPDLAREPDELTAANVVSSGIDSTSLFIGPAVGGLVLSFASIEAAFVLTALTFLWSALMVSRIETAPRAAAPAADGEERESFWVSARAGFSTVRHERPVRIVVTLMAAQLVVAGLEGTLIAALAFDVLEVGEGDLGFLYTALGVGGVIGVLLTVALVGRRGLATVLGVGCVLWGVPFALIGLAPAVAVVVAGLVVVGLANSLVDVSAYTLLQRVAPPDVLGRVFGILESLILASFALGAALAPALIALVDVRGALIVQGAFLPVVVVLFWRSLRGLDALADAGVAATRAALELLRGIPMLAPLPAPVIERLAGAAERVRIPAGATVFAQGDPGDRYYVVAEGSAAIEIDGARIGEAGPGEGFGEIALLRDTPRTGTVLALTDLELLALEREDFVPAVTGYPASAAEADAVVSRRLVFNSPSPSVA